MEWIGKGTVTVVDRDRPVAGGQVRCAVIVEISGAQVLWVAAHRNAFRRAEGAVAIPRHDEQ